MISREGAEGKEDLEIETNTPYTLYQVNVLPALPLTTYDTLFLYSRFASSSLLFPRLSSAVSLTPCILGTYRYV